MVAKLFSSDITELEAKLNDWLKQNPGIQIKGMTPVSSTERWVTILMIFQLSSVTDK